MSDKALDEVMQEFRNGYDTTEDLIKSIESACHAYAVKVLEEILKKPSTEKMGHETKIIWTRQRILDKIDRLKAQLKE